MHAWKWPQHFIRETYLHFQSPEVRKWDDRKLQRFMNFPIESYLQEMEGVVDKAIIVAVKFRKLGFNIPNDYVAECVKKYPDKFAGICCVDPTEEDAVSELERCVTELGMIGLKLLPVYQHFYPHEERYFPIYEKAQQLGIPVLFHTGYSYLRGTRLIFGDMRFIDEVAVNFPDLKIVIAHMGLTAYEDVVGVMEKNENVYADISDMAHWGGIDRRGIRRELPVTEFPYFRWLLPILYASSSVLIADRIFFGTDWPMVSPRTGVEALRSINALLKEYNLPSIPRITIDNILTRNWRQVYKL